MFSRSTWLVLLAAVLAAVLGGWLQHRSQSAHAESELRLQPGQPAPDLMLTDLDGHPHRLSDYRGRRLLLNFWASWCAPCQYEIPEFVKYQSEYGKRGLQIVGIGIDEERKLRNVARSLGINYPVLIIDPGDPEQTGILSQWGNDKQYIPYSVVIRKDGRITYIHRGVLDEEAFKEYVRPLIEPAGGAS